MVRQPIYTGILAGLLGTAIALSQVRGFIAFVLIVLVLWLKLRMEEQWMRSQFGETLRDFAAASTWQGIDSGKVGYQYFKYSLPVTGYGPGAARGAESGAKRTRFRDEGEQHSGGKPNIFSMIPEWCSV